MSVLVISCNIAAASQTYLADATSGAEHHSFHHLVERCGVEGGTVMGVRGQAVGVGEECL